MKKLILLSIVTLSFASCSTNSDEDLRCGIVRNKEIIYGKEYQNKDMPIGYSITTEYGTWKVSQAEYDSVRMSDTYCK